MYAYMTRQQRKFFVHWSQYIRAHYKKDVDYFENEDGEITAMTPECCIEVAGVVGTPQAKIGKRMMEQKLAREIQFDKNQKTSLLSVD